MQTQSELCRRRGANDARPAFVERDLQVVVLGALASQPDQVARTVETGDAGEAAPRELGAEWRPLAAAQIEPR